MIGGHFIQGWARTQNHMTLWSAELPDAPPTVDTMLVNGKRAILARYPNADPEVDKFPIGYISKAKKWTPPADMGKPTYIEYNESQNFRPSYTKLFTDYRGGVGGQCSHYTPPFSYWCAETPQGGGAAQFKVPVGLDFGDSLPNAPYADVKGAQVTAWRPGHWANWAFEVDKSGGPTSLHFSKGGFQGSRGNSNGGASRSSRSSRSSHRSESERRSR